MTFVCLNVTLYEKNKEVKNIYKQMSIQAERLKKKIDEVQAVLKSFPEGSLICARNGNYYKWYHTEGTDRKYIPKVQRNIAETLAAKKYYSFMLRDLLAEYDAVQSYLTNHKETVSETLFEHEEYKELLTPFFRPKSQELELWMNESYERNSNYSEQLNHKCGAGILVRSKSESLIVMSLHMHKIPFRYECALTLGETKIYPDFTIKHPKTGDVYYWEHFGMMDQPAYAKNAASKLQLYISHGIIPSIQLITTYETKEQPLNSVLIENMIQQYFL